MEQLTGGVEQISDVVQTNTATAEKSAASASEREEEMRRAYDEMLAVGDGKKKPKKTFRLTPRPRRNQPLPQANFTNRRKS